VVWLGARGDDTIGRILLDFYRAGTTTKRTPQEPQSLAGECRLLREAATPTVLSDQAADAVRARYSCVPSARLVVVPVSP
jgi:hypothetical protein